MPTGAARSPVPTREPQGDTQHWPWGALADCGIGDPSFYHQYFDDMDSSLNITGSYTVSKGSTGTAANAAGDGGLGLLTTAATNNDYVAIQLPAASFTLPNGALAGKKEFFIARLTLGDVNASAFICGLCNTTATIFTAVTDGLYFQKASGSAVINLIAVVGGVATTTPVPASALTLVNAVPFDLGWYVDFYGNVAVFVSSQLYGFIPESGGGGNPTPTRGRCLYIQNSNITNGLTAANLNVTAGVQAGAVAAKTLTIDFFGAMKER